MTQPQQQSWRDLIQAAGPVLAIAGILWAGAQGYQKLDDLGRRVDELEQTDRETKALDRANAERLARIEANLDYLVQERRGRVPNAR